MLGTITVTETGCYLDNAPELIEPGRFVLGVHNGTPAQAAFDMFRIGEPGRVEAFVAHVEDERIRAEAGEAFRGPPIWAHHNVGSDLLESGESATLRGTAERGRYAVVCLWKFETKSADPVRPFALVGPIGVGLTSRALTEADVGRILLREADAPAGASYLGTDVGREVLINPVWYLSSSEQQRFRDLPGFIHASASSYRLGSSSADPLFVSEVMLFDDAESAAHAMAAYAKEWESSFGFADPMPSTVELGEEGLLFSGPAAVQNGEPGFYYFWRVNNLLLNMVAVGPVEGGELDVMETTVRAMALEMDRRVTSPIQSDLDVVQAWVDALNVGDDEGAAALLAEGATAAFVGHAPTQDITAFHRRLDCSATIVSSRNQMARCGSSMSRAVGESIAVEMRMGSTRPGHTCPDPGVIITMTFVLRDGLIESIVIE